MNSFASRRHVIAAASAAFLGSMPAIAQNRVYRIGHDNPFEPFAFVENGQSRGLLIDMTTAILNHAGIAFEYRPLPLATIEADLAAGAIDALAFKGVSPERQLAMDFSAPLLITGGAAFARPGLPAASDLSVYAGKTIVTPTRGPLAAQIRRDYPQIQLLTVDSYDASLDAVVEGRADVAALNFQVGQQLVARKYPGKFVLPEQPYTKLPFAFAVAKGRETELLQRVDQSLAALRQDGTIDRLVERWMHG